MGAILPTGRITFEVGTPAPTVEEIPTDQVEETPRPEPEEKTNIKLEAQKIKDFGGAYDDWPKWKSRTECAFNGTGYEKILEDSEYASTHSRMNKVVFSQLSASTVDGTAHHLVAAVEDTKDGHEAWKNLCNWYDGDTVRNETASNLRVKLDNLRLHSGITASDYVNKFLAWYRDLNKIKGEGWSKNQAVYQFLKNISDSDYESTVQSCKYNEADLEKCISAIRKQERDIHQKKVEQRRFKSSIRRTRKEKDITASSDDDESVEEPKPKRQKQSKARRAYEVLETDNAKFEGELTTSEHGLLRFLGPCWKSMDTKAREFVHDYNAKVKHGESCDKLSMPKGISIKNKVRRTTKSINHDEVASKTPTKNRKKIGFNLTQNVDDEDTGLHEE